MHVAYLLSGFHSQSGGGGAESYVSTMAEDLIERGHRVSIIALGEPAVINGGPRLVKVRQPNLHWFVYRALPFGKSLAMTLREFEWSRTGWSAVAELHRQDPIDVVETGENMALQQLSIGKKPPVIVRGHGNALSIKRFGAGRPGLGDRIGRKLQLAGMKHASAITAVSNFQAKELASDLSLSQDSVSVIPNPISPLFLKQAQEIPRLEPQRPAILYTGRIELNKGTLVLLTSVAQVASQFPAVEYVIAGGRHNSIDDRSLESALGENGTRDHIRLLGHVPWEQLADLYRQASVFVMPSYYETFGISVIEAMAFGLPVVATTAGGLPEVVEDGVTGILVPPGDSQALSDALIRLLRDPDLRRRLGRAGKERVHEEFTVDQIVPKTLAVYESVVQAERGIRISQELTSSCAS
jgi:glycosyltransferase involved in cell wall biosynthesis